MVSAATTLCYHEKPCLRPIPLRRRGSDSKYCVRWPPSRRKWPPWMQQRHLRTPRASSRMSLVGRAQHWRGDQLEASQASRRSATQSEDEKAEAAMKKGDSAQNQVHASLKRATKTSAAPQPPAANTRPFKFHGGTLRQAPHCPLAQKAD
jgi:hypothetical protein